MKWDSNVNEDKLWREAIFVFDTSALLNFYEYSTDSIENIFKTLLIKLKGRLWIPNQVKQEYLKNRLSTIEKPIQKYINLRDKNFKNIENNLNEIINSSESDLRHPFLYMDKEKIKSIKVLLTDIKSSICNEVQSRIDQINETKNTDSIKEFFEEIFYVGEPMLTKELLLIIKEGEDRYKNRIPPGYSDQESKSKTGYQKYGDLIIWKEILNKAKTEKSSIILISDDMKEDWWQSRVEFIPRHELINEFEKVTQCEFWMYTSAKFLEKASELISVELANETIIEVKGTTENKVLEPDWEKIVDANNAVGLSGYNYVFIRNEKLKSSIYVMWNYLDYELIISPLEDSEIKIDENEVYYLKGTDYLVLNPHIPAVRWLFSVIVVDGRLKFKPLYGPKADVTIRDQQE